MQTTDRKPKKIVTQRRKGAKVKRRDSEHRRTAKGELLTANHKLRTEGVGFEPTDPFGSPVFKTGAINRSTIPPELRDNKVSVDR